MEKVYFLQSDLDVLRLLLVGAGCLLAWWWYCQLRAERPDKPKAQPKRVIYCPLHRIDRDDCQHKHEE